MVESYNLASMFAGRELKNDLHRDLIDGLHLARFPHKFDVLDEFEEPLKSRSFLVKN